MKEKYTIEIASTIEELEEVKVLDDKAFGPHLGITLDELVEITKHGKVLMLRDETRRLIGESQVIVEGISHHPHLDDDEAYYYGTAIQPDLQRQGFSQVLYRAQEGVALEAGKKRATLTVRLENSSSIRARMKAGYVIVRYDKNRYGPFEEGGARLIMEKNLVSEGKAFDPKLTANRFRRKKIPVTDFSNPTGDNQSRVVDLSKLNGRVAVPINCGDKIDYLAHSTVESLLQKNYIGTGLLCARDLPTLDNNLAFLIFEKDGR